MKQTVFWSRKLYRRAIQEVGSRFYINPDPEVSKSILVAGTARSGTTWLGDLIASQIPCRTLFEPFNPELVREYRGFPYFQYIRPEDENAELQAFSQNVLTGEIRNRWIDHQNEKIFAKYRLVKEIRANLLLKWLNVHFPDVPIVLLVRHPCAVVQSRMHLGWATDDDIAPFLSQPELVEDYLVDYLDMIRTVKTEEEKHAMIWCINHLVPFKQFMPGELKVVFYEDLCMQPDAELSAVFNVLGQKYDPARNNRINRPSQTTKVTSAVVTGSNKISYWKNVLSSIQIQRILNIVRAFGLEHLYGDSVVPLHAGIESRSAM